MNERFNGWLVLGAGLLLLLFFKKIRSLIREVYGTIDKLEFSGILFFILLCYMTWKDANRLHEWRIFSDAQYIIVTCVAITGLGATVVFRHLKGLKGFVETTQRTETVQIKTQTNVKETEKPPVVEEGPR